MTASISSEGSVPSTTSRAWDKRTCRGGWALPVAIGLFVWVVVVLTAARDWAGGDANLMCEAARSLVKTGQPTLDTETRIDVLAGPDGHRYGKYPLLAVLQCAPAVVLHDYVQKLEKREGPLSRLAATATPAAVAACLAMIFFALCVELGYRRRLAALCSLALIFTTPIWVYARRLYSEVLQGALLGLCVWLWVRVLRKPSATRALLAGFATGLVINAKATLGVVVLGAAVSLLWKLKPRQWLRVGAFAGVGFAPGAIALLAFNHMRYGDYLELGYSMERDGSIGFGTPLLVGLHGLLLSSGKSVFLYAPLLVLALVGAPRMARVRRAEFVVLGAPAFATLLLVAKWWDWSGDWGWGPRLLIPIMPLLLVPMLETVLRPGPRRWIAAALATAGIAVQVLGLAIHDSDYLSIAHQTFGASVRYESGDTPVRDDLAVVHFVPEASPIVGHAWLLAVAVRGQWNPSDGYPWEGMGISAWKPIWDHRPPALNLWFVADSVSRTALAIGGGIFLVLAAALATLLWRTRDRALCALPLGEPHLGQAPTGSEMGAHAEDHPRNPAGSDGHV